MPKTIFAEVCDCIFSLAALEDLPWEYIWNHPENRALRDQRKEPGILKRGDRVFVPERRKKLVPRATAKTHEFLYKRPPATVTLVLFRLGLPRKNEKGVLVIDGTYRIPVETNGEGVLTAPIPPRARRGTLTIGEDQEVIELELGGIDPIAELSGVQGRLQNLGFFDGECNGEGSPETDFAIAEFRRWANVEDDGGLTDETRLALVKAHGS